MNEHFFHFHMKPIWQLDFLRKKAAKSCHIVFICEKSGERPGEISKSPLKHEIFTIFSLKFFFSYFDGLATLNLQVIVFIYMTTATLGHNLKMISHQKKMPTFLKSGVPFNCRCSVKICWSYDVHTTHHLTPSTWKRQRDLKPELMKFLPWLIWFFKLSKTRCQQISSTWGRSLSLSLKWVGMLHFLFRESAGPKTQKRRLVVV